MGVYIPNMSKPKDSCWECKAQYNSVCSLNREYIKGDGILDDCPLTEIDDTEWEWCHDCKEYDQEAHCCHRWTKVIRQTVEDVKVNYTIVTCRECKYWTGDCTNEIWQSPTDDYLPQTNADDFCSYGERRADEID